MEARITGSHCGGQAWSISASSLATLGFVMCETKAAQKAAATPMRTSARKKSFFTTSASLLLVFCLASACSATGCLDTSLAAIFAACLVVTQSGMSFICVVTGLDLLGWQTSAG